MRRNMSSRSANSMIGNRRLALALCFYAGLFIVIHLAGCSAGSSSAVSKNRYPVQEELSAPYDRIVLKESLTLDALPKIRRSQNGSGSPLAETETVSHSDRVVASLGQSPDGYSTWFNMVTFHQYRLNVIRKYFFAVEDRAGSLRARPRRGLRLECEMVLDKGTLDKSSTSENAERIAILRYVLEYIHKDINELGGDVDVPGQYNKQLDVCGMLINQMFETVLVNLESSPILAASLNQAGGVEFDHINFNKGTVQMLVADDTVSVRARFGSFAQDEK